MLRLFCLQQSLPMAPVPAARTRPSCRATARRGRATNTTAPLARSLRRFLARLSPFTASQGGLLAQPPLAIPRGTRLRGPSGSLRCSIYRGSVKLVATLLRHPTLLFPDKSVLLARVNGTEFRAHFTLTDHSHAPRGNSCPDAPRPMVLTARSLRKPNSLHTQAALLKWRLCQQERLRRSHAPQTPATNAKNPHKAGKEN